jgi:hypothetical protein
MRIFELAAMPSIVSHASRNCSTVAEPGTKTAKAVIPCGKTLFGCLAFHLFERTRYGKA